MEASYSIDGTQMSRMVVNREGTSFWYNEHGDLHREDGPAIEYRNGDKEWWQDGARFRFEYASGTVYWYKNHRIHRDDGPAIERKNGKKEYWYIGIRYQEIKNDEQWKRLIKLMILE